ncbi:MAG: carboxypeptidase regulatory-like domain-containing protein [Saprospiraceae bacterium]|nr:carboxypeptidase regulatory-like domain-containing protein [Pyrinomonadaceae bacterium]
MKRLKFVALMFLCAVYCGSVRAQTTVFSDDFGPPSSIFTSNGQIGASAFSVTSTGIDWGARRNFSPEQLELTNDISGTPNVNGWVFASTPTGSFGSPYNTTLSSNTGLVTWTFNMRQIRTDPAGFSAGAYGVAFILGGTSTTAATVGDGYAVVLGQTGNIDPVRLLRYTNGLQGSLTEIITSNTLGLTDFGNHYTTVRVTYNPSNNLWELFVRNDGTFAFDDPTSPGMVSQGAVADNTFTGTPLTALGAYWQGSTVTTQTAFFDNLGVTVVNAPTAADTSVGGRVSTADGRGIRNAAVIISGGNLPESRRALTGSFGYYRFDGLPAGETYVLSVGSKRYSFSVPARTVTLNDELSNVDFTALP